MTKKIEVFASEAQQGELEAFPNIKRGWGVTKEVTGGIPPMKWFNSIQKRTDEAINAIAEGSISGYTFKDGATLESHNDLIYDDVSKSWYFWIGESSKVIPPDSDASEVIESDGGIWSEANPDGLWVSVGDASLRSDIGVITKTYKTVQQMKSDSYIQEGSNVEWLGYYTESDGGGNSGVVKRGQHIDDGGSVFSISENLYVSANLIAEFVDARKFGVFVGVSDIANRVNKALEYMSPSKIPTLQFSNGTYLLSDSINVRSPVSINFNGSVLKKEDGVVELFDCRNIGSGVFELKNGTLDGQNRTNTHRHLLRFDDKNTEIVFNKMTFKNNIKKNDGKTVTNIDSDLAYILNAKKISVEKCVFDGCSRNGISVIDSGTIQVYRDNEFRNCYLYGIDVEPNNENGIMYDTITFDNNYFKDCGPKGQDDYVWDFGGGAQVLSRKGLQICKRVNVINNTVDMSGSKKTNANKNIDGIRVDDTASISYLNNSFSNCQVLINAGARSVGDSLYINNNDFNNSSLAAFRINAVSGATNNFSGDNATVVIDNYSALINNSIKFTCSMFNCGSGTSEFVALFSSKAGIIDITANDTRHQNNAPQSILKHKGEIVYNLKVNGSIAKIVSDSSSIEGAVFDGGYIKGAVDFVGNSSVRVIKMKVNKMILNISGIFVNGYVSGDNKDISISDCSGNVGSFVNGRTFSNLSLKGNDIKCTSFYNETGESESTIITSNVIRNSSSASIVSFSKNSAISGNVAISSAAFNINASSDKGGNIVI